MRYLDRKAPRGGRDAVREQQASDRMKSPPRLAVALFLLSLAASCSGPVQESPEAKTTKPRAAQLSGRAETLKTAHPKWNDADCNAIAEGKIRLYMNQEQVRAAWGEPDRIKVVADSEA